MILTMSGWKGRIFQLFSDHPGGVNVLMCDGAVRFLNQTTEKAVVCGLASRNVGEAVSIE